MNSLCIFCGSSSGAGSVYAETARHLGRLLAGRGIRIVYGGGCVGLMGELADAALAAGGDVIGVIPEGLVAREVAHKRVTDLRIVKTMHERKALMSDLSDGFVALPGGAGTLEEFFEVWTWTQLGIYRKPAALLNVAGYFDGLLTFLDHAVAQRFLRDEHRAMVLVDDDPERLLDRLRSTRMPDVPKWIERDDV